MTSFASGTVPYCVIPYQRTRGGNEVLFLRATSELVALDNMFTVFELPFPRLGTKMSRVNGVKVSNS